MKEKNVLCIDDSNTILRDIIDGSDAPFVYEKTGVWYEHFLLDEFQDTSEVQWDNFLPLLTESESKAGSSNLIVGDVKQSIYRWRGSNWKLLQNTVPEKFPSASHKPLETNWRSLNNVVEFNNGFFTMASELLDKVTSSKEGSLAEIYAGVTQKVAPKNERGGSISLTFCDKSMEIDTVLGAIQEVVDAGASYSDIAILVRSNSTGGEIANALTENGIPVITDDSLRVKSALTVRRIVSLMTYVDNPEDTIHSFLARSLEVDLPTDWTNLVDLAETIFRSLCKSDEKQQYKGEILHIQSFFDYLQDYVSSEGNNLRGFLHQFDADDPAISSPSSGNSVRVMTVHKSKGLDFNYVIFPFSENCDLFKQTKKWCRPKVEGTELESCADGIYRVNLSSKMNETLFSDSFREECFMQMVDSLNTYYVATTRARKGMTIISKMPADSFLKSISDNASEYPSAVSDMSQLLYTYVRKPSTNPGFREIECDGGLRLRFGDEYKFSSEVVADTGDISGYPSWPLDGRLEFSSEAGDFFTGDDVPGSSGRLKGIVLHDILSRVRVPSDLEAAVRESFNEGSVSEEDMPEIISLLSSRIESVAGRRWFAEDLDAERNEVDVIDSDGEIYRPDRVVTDGGTVQIIDYKFGRPSPEYEDQVRNYARIYREMGYSDVRASLWYVRQGRIVDVE